MPPNPQISTFLMWQIRKYLDGKPYRITLFIESSLPTACHIPGIIKSIYALSA